MTTEERAKALIKTWQNRTIWTEEMITDVCRELTAAIEAEREACAQIVHKSYQEWFDGDHSPGEAFRIAEDRIRYGARSASTAPHAFKGRTDRWCEVCNRPDRDPIHKGQNASISEIDRKIENS